MNKTNLFYAQSGGATAVINASACGVIETARLFPDKIGKVYAGVNGILGLLGEEMIDTSHESSETISALKHTPGAIFGSCRYKLKTISESEKEYRKLFEIFEAHNIGIFLYNGGNDSQDTTHKLAQMATHLNYPLICIGIPKTIDNDLCVTDNCPGFGSVAKYVAVSIKEASLDIASMAKTSTKVFVMEVMGRNAGWIAAAGGLASQEEGEAPHIILFPEIPFDEEAFLKETARCVRDYGFCSIVVSEGTRDRNGRFLSDSGFKDAFGHTQLGGVAPVIAQLIKNRLEYKCHWAVSDYLQRAASHLASLTDIQQAYALGEAAVHLALEGKSDLMPTIVRHQEKNYSWTIGHAPLTQIANKEKHLPRSYISENGFHITSLCKDYLFPLIQGEGYPPYKEGLPLFAKLEAIRVEPRAHLKDL